MVIEALPDRLDDWLEVDRALEHVKLPRRTVGKLTRDRHLTISPVFVTRDIETARVAECERCWIHGHFDIALWF
jgi:hypothetical protein